MKSVFVVKLELEELELTLIRFSLIPTVLISHIVDFFYIGLLLSKVSDFSHDLDLQHHQLKFLLEAIPKFFEDLVGSSIQVVVPAGLKLLYYFRLLQSIKVLILFAFLDLLYQLIIIPFRFHENKIRLFSRIRL